MACGLAVAQGCSDDASQTSPGADAGAGSFTIPAAGGTATVQVPGGTIDFVFPASAGGKTVTLTLSDAAAIGWPADQFGAVIKMEPDGMQFADPVVVRPSSLDLLLFTFPTNATKSKPEALALGPSGDGLLLSHFSTLAVVKPTRSCDTRSGWTSTDSAPACASFGPASTRLTFDCTTDPYCARVTAHCCVTPGAQSGCPLGARDLALTYEASPNPPAYCGGAVDGGSDAPDAAPAAITVTTRLTSYGPVLGAKADVTWAAYRDATGAWKALAPASTGTYTFTTDGPKWGVALACSSGGDLTSSVAIYYRTTATTSLEADACAAAAQPPYHKVTGNLSNLPASTTKLAFGHGFGSLNTTLTVTGTDAPYTLFTVAEGTWDFAYGTQDSFTTPLTRALFRRAEIVGTTDRTLDIDMNAAGSFVPGAKNVTVRGLTAGETLGGSLFFTMQGYPVGMSVANGPGQLVPDNTFPYSTIPAAAAVASDVYRGAYDATVPGGATGRRVVFDFKTPVDVDVAFPAFIAGLAATVSSTTPYVRLETKANAVTNADLYQVAATASAGQTSRQSWSMSYDAAALSPATSLDDVMPDLSAVPGWKNAWALPTGIEASVTVKIVEKSTALSDGTSVRSASAITKLTP